MVGVYFRAIFCSTNQCYFIPESFHTRVCVFFGVFWQQALSMNSQWLLLCLSTKAQWSPRSLGGLRWSPWNLLIINFGSLSDLPARFHWDNFLRGSWRLLRDLVNWRAHFQNLINPLLMKMEFLTTLYRITLELVTEWNLDPDNLRKYIYFSI